MSYLQNDKKENSVEIGIWALVLSVLMVDKI